MGALGSTGMVAGSRNELLRYEGREWGGGHHACVHTSRLSCRSALTHRGSEGVVRLAGARFEAYRLLICLTQVEVPNLFVIL